MTIPTPTRARLVIFICLLAGCGLSIALAADVDLQQYNGTSTWSSDLTAASMLLPRDGKYVTADNNASGKAPVNRSLKQIKDLLIGMHDGIFGSRSGSQLRSVRSLYADGSGGASYSMTNGTIKAHGNLISEAGNVRANQDVSSDTGNIVALVGKVTAGDSVFAGRSASSGTTPNPLVEDGEYTKQSAPIGMASVASAGALWKGQNIHSVSRGSAGHYTVVFRRVFSTLTDAIVVVTPFNTTDACEVGRGLDGSNRLSISVVCPFDTDFSIVAWAM